MVFSILIKVFYFILVSSLGVHLYTSRSSAKDFFTKSVRPEVLFSLRIRESYYFYLIFRNFALIYLNS